MRVGKLESGSKRTLAIPGERRQVAIALVITDIVNSTVIARKLGDPAWIETLIKHFERARHYLAKYGGHEVKLIGDASMIAFPTADKALLFALDFFKDPGDPAISIRAGIHVGPVLVLDNDIHGSVVTYTSRMQEAIKGSGIALSAAAKSEIENRLGVKINEFGKVRPLSHASLKGFGADKQLLWKIVTPEIGAKAAEAVSRIVRGKPQFLTATDLKHRRSRKVTKPNHPISYRNSKSSASRPTLSQRIYGTLKFDGDPPNDEQVKDMVTDYLAKKYS